MTTAIPTFRALGLEVLAQRDAQGVRGISREVNRWHCHLSDASFIDSLVTDIRAPEIRAWLRMMRTREARVRAGEPVRTLDRSTINRVQSLVSVVLEEAVERELVATNVAKGVKLKRSVSESDTVEKWSYLTRAEQAAILACPAITRTEKLAMLFAWGTGCRAGEQFNLTLDDVHVDGDDPHIRIRFSNPLKGVLMPPKSGKKRRVPLMPETLEATREWLAMLPTFCPSNPLNLVFPTEYGRRRQQGKPLGRSRMPKKIYALAGIAPRKGLHWHALRHTFASNLVADGLRLEIIQVLMGHSSVVITQRYAHMSDDDVLRAVRALSARSPSTVPTPLFAMPPEALPELVPMPPPSWTGFDDFALQEPS